MAIVIYGPNTSDAVGPRIGRSMEILDLDTEGRADRVRGRTEKRENYAEQRLGR